MLIMLSPPASLPIKGEVTTHTTVKWPIAVSVLKECVLNQQNLLIKFLFKPESEPRDVEPRLLNKCKQIATIIQNDSLIPHA